MLFTLALFAGSVLSFSLTNGVRSMSGRLGADVMIIPDGYDAQIDSILLTGKPSSFYLPANVLDELQAISEYAGIESLSPQTFLATLNASCCAYPVQLVGIDYGSDFTVKAWQKSSLTGPLNDREIIVGYQVAGWPGDKIKFFGQNLTVAGRLEETGTGFDAMIFMNMNTIAMLAHEAEIITGSPLNNDRSLISVVMVKLKAGYDSVASAIEINRLLGGKGINAVFSKKFVNAITDGLKLVSGAIWFRLAFFWFMAVIITGLLFAMTVSERKREFGIYRALGATRGKIIFLCIAEVFMTSFYGSTLGLLLGVITIATGSPAVTRVLHLPFLLPGITRIILLGTVSIIVSVMTGIISGAWPAFKAGRTDIQDIMKL